MDIFSLKTNFDIYTEVENLRGYMNKYELDLCTNWWAQGYGASKFKKKRIRQFLDDVFVYCPFNDGTRSIGIYLQRLEGSLYSEEEKIVMELQVYLSVINFYKGLSENWSGSGPKDYENITTKTGFINYLELKKIIGDRILKILSRNGYSMYVPDEDLEQGDMDYIPGQVFILNSIEGFNNLKEFTFPKPFRARLIASQYLENKNNYSLKHSLLVDLMSYYDREKEVYRKFRGLSFQYNGKTIDLNKYISGYANAYAIRHDRKSETIDFYEGEGIDLKLRLTDNLIKLFIGTYNLDVLGAAVEETDAIIAKIDEGSKK